MRYVLAMICGFVCAAAAGKFIAVTVAPWIARQFTYTSPDASNDVEQLSFVAILGAGLLVGWVVGWMLGGSFERRRRSS